MSWPFSTFTSPCPAKSVIFHPLSVLPSNRLCQSAAWLTPPAVANTRIATNRIAFLRGAWRHLQKGEFRQNAKRRRSVFDGLCISVFSLPNKVCASFFAQTKQRVEEKKTEKAAPESVHSGAAERGTLRKGASYLAGRASMMFCASPTSAATVAGSTFLPSFTWTFFWNSRKRLTPASILPRSNRRAASRRTASSEVFLPWEILALPTSSIT